MQFSNSVIFNRFSVFNWPIFLLVYTLYISYRVVRMFGRQLRVSLFCGLIYRFIRNHFGF